MDNLYFNYGYCYNCGNYHDLMEHCYYPGKNYTYYPIIQKFEFKCICGGEFNTPSVSKINMLIKVCPFCNLEMKGL